MLRAFLSSHVHVPVRVRPFKSCALASQRRRGAPQLPRASSSKMDSELAAIRREAAARHAAASAAAAAAASASAAAAVGAAAGPGDAEDASLALAKRLQAEGDARARAPSRSAGVTTGGSDDDEVQIIDPPPKRQRQDTTPGAPAANGVGFALTRCASAAPEHNIGAVSLTDIFPTDGRTPRFVIVSNYMFEFPWLLQACPALVTAPSVFMFTSANASGGGDFARASLRNFSVFHPVVPSFGTHHSKFIIIAYDTHVRVCIHTANYVSVDWGDKTEGVWMQDFALKVAGAQPAGSNSVFEDDLVDYVTKTGWPGGLLADGTRCGPDALRRYDFSAARVALVASVPGSHDGIRYGTRRMRALLQRERFDPRGVGAPMIWQFTSNGTVRADLLAEFRNAFCAGCTSDGTLLGQGQVRLVWPTVEEVRRSYEGWAGGGAIPGKRENIQRPEIRALHHRWAADPSRGGRDTCPEGRARALPHIKIFMRHQGPLILWLLLGSHNLSGPAWGTETKKRQLRINSFELGVMFLPSLLPQGATEMACTAVTSAGVAGGMLGLRVPFSLPPAPYGPADEPWDVETPRMQPDSRGCIAPRDGP